MTSPLDMPWGGATSSSIDQVIYGSPFISRSLRYQKDQTSGTLMKESNTYRHFSKKQTRFVILDHKSGVMKIYSENNLMSSYKSTNYSDVALIEVKRRAGISQSNSQERLPISQQKSKWSYRFIIEMIDGHRYDFCAPSEKERELWVHSLAWIMLSNHIVGLPRNGVREQLLEDSETVLITGKLVFESIMSKLKNKR